MSNNSDPLPPLPWWDRLRFGLAVKLSAVFFSLCTILLAGLSRVVSRKRLHALFRPVCRAAIGIAGIRVSCRGLEHVPAEGAFVLVCNHVNMFDAIIIYTVIDRPFAVIEKASHFRRPFYGRLTGALGNLPVASGETELSRRSLALAAQDLHEGMPVVIFPEGTRHATARLGEFKMGAAHLALETRRPLIPLAFKDAQKLYSDGLVRPGVEHLVFLPPVDLDAYGDHDHERLLADLHARMAAELEAEA